MHKPSVAPDCFLQIPVQHSVSAPQASPVWAQNEGFAAQLPFWQRCEQHCVLSLQLLPAVLHAEFNGAQTPAPASFVLQMPLQHSLPFEQAWLSLTQSEEPQLPPSHTSVQHSVGEEHDAPATLHSPGGFAHAWSVGSQNAVQQSPLVAQLVPTSSQFGLTSTPPPVPPPLVPPWPAPAWPPVPESFLGVDESSSSPPQLCERKVPTRRPTAPRKLSSLRLIMVSLGGVRPFSG